MKIFTGLWLIFFSVFLSAIPFSSAASRAPVSSAKGLVASVSPLASEVGVKVLRDGGNAVDAAIATAFALAVTWPSAGNIGGGGFALVRKTDGESFFYDYRETAALKTHRDFYQKLPESASTIGYLAVGTPGTVAGMALMHQQLGKLPWSRLVEPAYQLAAKGFPIDDALLKSLESNRKLLSQFPESEAIFLKSQWKRGDILIQKDLAWSLRHIQKKGAAAFYQGELGQRLVKSVEKAGGVLSLEDLKGYQAKRRKPLVAAYKDYEIITAPPPSSGGLVLLAMLKMLEKDDLKASGFGSAATNHLLVEVMKRAFADRSEWFGDPDFVNVPQEQLLDPQYLAKRRASISLQKASPSQEIKPGSFSDTESKETTHFTIRDAEGMIVSNTYTLNGSFGSGAVAAGTGILLNNEMDDFSTKPGTPNMYRLLQSERNAIAPGKRPLSSMTPTIVLKEGKPILALGSPGGPTIINSVFQVMINVLEHGMNIQEAIDAPKLHHQWFPDKIRYEPFGLNPDSRKLMEAMGHQFEDRIFAFGDVEAVYFDPKLQVWTGASDSRQGGKTLAE